MDDRTKSLLTTVLTALLGSAATWLVNKGIITADETTAFISVAIGLIFALGAAVMAWWKSKSHSPEATTLAASKVPGVQVAVTSDASEAVKKVAAQDNPIQLVK